MPPGLGATHGRVAVFTTPGRLLPTGGYTSPRGAATCRRALPRPYRAEPSLA